MSVILLTGKELIDTINSKIDLTTVKNIVKITYTAGVVLENATSLQTNLIGSNSVVVYPGTVIFEDGSIFVLENQTVVDFVPGDINYVYFRNKKKGTDEISIVCSTDESTTSDILLAEVDEKGNVVDKRIYVKGKIPLM